MGRKNRKKPKPAQPTEPRLLVTATGLILLLSQVAILPGAYSPFRQPKMSLALAGLAVLTGGFVAAGLWRQKLRLRTGPLAMALISLPILHALSALWAPSPRSAFSTAVAALIFVGATLMMADWSTAGHRRATRWAITGAVLSSVVLVAQISGMELVTLPGNVQGERYYLTGLAGNPSDLAMGCILLLPLVLLPVFRHKHQYRLWLVPLFFAATALTGQTLTAGAALGLIGLGTLFFLRSKRAWIAAGIVMCLALLLIAASPLKSRLEKQVRRVRHGNWYALLSAREDGWTAATAMFLHAPLTGVGSGQFSREFYPARLAWLEKREAVGHRGELATHFEWTHNDPLQLTAELGALGILWMLTFAYGLLRRQDRGSPLIVLGLLAWGPFLFLHYPTHLAVGLVPAVLVVSKLLRTEDHVTVSGLAEIPRKLMAVVICCGVLAVVLTQLQVIRLDYWRGMAEEGLAAAEHAQGQQRAQLLQSVESQTVARISRQPGAAPWLWRLAGRARLLAGAYPEAEHAFRRAGALAPHEEAEMGLGIALAGQNRTTEAIHHLTRACRLNPKLTLLIRQLDLRSAVQDRLHVNDRGIPRRRK